MIRSFRHKGLERLYGRGDRRGVPVELAGKVSRILNVMNTAEKISELGLFPGWRLHRLRGGLKGYWSISVSGNWRIAFRFERGDIHGVDFIDYH